jgi:hypothetical protein
MSTLISNFISPGNGYPLLLSPGQLCALLPHAGLVALGQVGDELVDVGLTRRSHHLLHGHVSRVVPVADVVRQAAVEEDRLLRHDAQLGADPGHAEGGQVVVLQRDNTRGEVVEALEQLDTGGLAAAGRAHWGAGGKVAVAV